MYLSRLQPDRKSSQVRKDLSSAYQMHATLCRAFCEPDETPPRFLWRLEEGRQQVPTVLLQSRDLPDWNRLEARFPGYLGGVESKNVPFEQLEYDQVLRFRVQANPTVSHKAHPDDKRGKRTALTSETDQLEWLEKQGLHSGFEPFDFGVLQSEKLRLYKHSRQGQPITLQSALFEGRLTITDLERFLITLEGGIGHAKALGFGLLSIAAH